MVHPEHVYFKTATVPFPLNSLGVYIVGDIVRTTHIFYLKMLKELLLHVLNTLAQQEHSLPPLNIMGGFRVFHLIQEQY